MVTATKKNGNGKTARIPLGEGAGSGNGECRIAFLRWNLRLPGLIAIQKIGAQKGTYQAVLDDDTKINLGTARQILGINNVRAAILDATGRCINGRKIEWPKIVEAITSLGNANVTHAIGGDR